ncbi:MAG TPA: CvpA family protein [Epulopiscium sp.]|nr:CvpA family protein [Candidatus Epulonipiscium sp.]
MNTLDWIIIAVIGISAITAYYRGFLYTTFRMLSTIIAIYLSYIGYRPINSMLRKTFLYDGLQKVAISNVKGLQAVMGLNEQTKLINSLNLAIPNSIKEGLIQNNNPEIYKLLGVDNFEAYIGGYIANFYLSIIAFILLWCVVKAILHLIGESIHILTKLPLIRFADRWMGFIVGLVKGILGIWIGTVILAFLIGLPKFQALSVLLSQSILGQWFYENNLILDIIDQLFI